MINNGKDSYKIDLAQTLNGKESYKMDLAQTLNGNVMVISILIRCFVLMIFTHQYASNAFWVRILIFVYC